MATYSERRRRSLYGPRIAIVAGVLVAVIGLYFVVGISRSTNEANAQCTEEVTGTVTESLADGGSYRTSVEYTPGYSPMTVTYQTKQQYEEGTEVRVLVHPTSFSKVYIEGMTPTGREDVATGIKFLIAGAALCVVGYLLEKMRTGPKTE